MLNKVLSLIGSATFLSTLMYVCLSVVCLRYGQNGILGQIFFWHRRT